MTQKTAEKPYVSSPMNELERKLHYPLGDTMPEFGHAIEVAPGVKWLRIGLPFALNHINLWLLRDHIDGQDGWTVVDCCIDRAESRAQWEQRLALYATAQHHAHVGLFGIRCATACRSTR